MDNPCNYLYDGQSYGKVVYFITLFPYVVLTTFLIMGLQQVSYMSPLDQQQQQQQQQQKHNYKQDGFASGITDYYLNPDWERLYNDVDIWVDACTQVAIGCYCY